MATWKPKKRAFSYKRAVFVAPTAGETLQSLLARALQTYGLPIQRQETLALEESQFRWINYNSQKGRSGGGGAMLACEFISYTKGANLGAINFAENVAHFDVDELPPPTGKEYLEGSVYFGVLDNHVVLLQSSVLRTRDLEQHLNWLLRNKARVIMENNAVSLDDNLPAESGDLSQAKGLVLDAPVHFQTMGTGANVTKEDVREVRRARKRKRPKESPIGTHTEIIPVGRAWDAVKAFFGEGFNLPGSLNVEDLLRSNNLRVKLQLLWTNTRGQDSADFVRNVAHRLRHVTDEVEYAVQTKSGLIGRNVFKPTQDYSIQWGKVRPNFNDLFPKMLGWLEKLLERNIITP